MFITYSFSAYFHTHLNLSVLTSQILTDDVFIIVNTLRIPFRAMEPIEVDYFRRFVAHYCPNH
jgi:hypothetical protein